MHNGLTISLASEVSRARALTAKRRVEFNMLTERASERAEAADACRAEMQLLGDCVVVMQNFATQIQTGIIAKFEDLLNRGIREIFKRDYKAQVVFEAKANSFWADIYVTLPNGNRVPINNEGGGMRELASMLSRILYVVLDPTQPAKILFLDESLSQIDEWRYPDGFKFIMDICTQLGIQVIWITHNAAISSRELDLPEARIIRFDLENDQTVVNAI